MVNEFVSAASNPAFWEDASDYILDDPHMFWFLKKIGLGDNPHFIAEVDNMIRQQTIEGHIFSNEFNHSGSLRVLVETKPDSEILFNAVSFWLKNWKWLSYDAKTLAVGILALTELGFEKYLKEIREETEYLKKFQNEDGYWGRFLNSSFSKKESIENTSYAVWAISRVNGVKDPAAQKGLKWLAEKQKEDGSWDGYTATALLALLAMGEGPKVPIELVEYHFMKQKQSIKKQKPIFVHTSPLYKGTLHVKEIYNKVSQMLHKAKKTIRIISPFIDMFYEELINLKQEKPDLVIKIITRPKKEIGGMRERIAKNVIDLLNIATKGYVVQSELAHSRMIVIDEEEVLVSSADLTRDQLFDEFNAGIWTSDQETVKKAVEFFENLFQMEKEKAG